MIDRGGNERINDVDLRSEMRQAYLDYAMSVIVSRALPDVRDGLKPVQRRILYAMYEEGIRPDRPFRKSANVTGVVMAKYHPHGDAPIYDALVRLAQDFSVRYPLIQGQGNFGCFSGETKVELTNGDQKTFIELIDMVRHGLRADVFTVDQHRNVRLKPVRAPRLVKRNEPVVKVSLSNANEITCTPDHRFMLRDGTYREAQSLRPKDQLMPFSRSAIPERLHRTGAFPIPASLQVRVEKVEPAGRTDVYDLTVDITQNFALSAGVFVHNSIDDDPPAAPRYTEARLAAIAMELLADIEKNTVDFEPNYDSRHMQPVVLPARLPNLLVNGSSGIAVGMATNIPPHNLREVIEATKRLIDDPELTIDDLCETITGPDFPGGGLVYRFEEQRNVETGKAERVDALRRAYGNGRGRVIMRARAHLEEMRGGRTAIIVSELPYAVNKAALIEKIAELVQAKKLAGISDIRDESDREGMRIHIEVKRDDDPQRVLNSLYKHTAMQSAFNFNMLALVHDQPRTLSLKDVLQAHIDYRRDVIRRRSEHDLAKARERAHILEGFKIALDNIDEIVKTIRASKSPDAALESLQKKFALSEAQAKAILDMQLRRLTGLERAKIEEEYEATIKLIAELESILASPRKVLGLIKADLDDLATTYGDERRTKIIDDTVRELSDEDLVADEDVVVTVSSRNYVKRMPLSTYRAQHRGGRGVIGMQTRDEDDVEHLLVGRTHDRLLVFTDRGRVFALKIHELPDASRTAKGTPIQNILEAMQAGERVSALVALRDNTSSAQHLVMATRKGFVKKTPIEEYANVRRAGLIAIALRKGDVLAWVAPCSDKDRILLATKKGKGIVFQATDARPMGRSTQGVTGIRLKKGDGVVGMGIVRPRTQVLSVTERGFGKRTDVEEFPTQGRGGQGVILAAVSDKTADVAAIEMVDEATQEVLLISTTGVVIRVPLDQIRVLSRATQGVKVMATGDAAIASIASFTGTQTQTELKLTT